MVKVINYDGDTFIIEGKGSDINLSMVCGDRVLPCSFARKEDLNKFMAFVEGTDNNEKTAKSW